MKSILMLLCSLLVFSCLEKEEKIDMSQVFEEVNISSIPKDTLSYNSLILDNGVYKLNGKPYSGILVEKIENGKIKTVGSYLNGMQHGDTKTYYENGSLRDKRAYKENKAYGVHKGNWDNGKPKFEFFYVNDKREGLQKQWYISGDPYAFLTFKNDAEEGMQQAWRETGKPYINYEVKNGKRYGLQKAGLCYTLKDGKLK